VIFCVLPRTVTESKIDAAAKEVWRVDCRFFLLFATAEEVGLFVAIAAAEFRE
jgi:hypothetical protein